MWGSTQASGRAGVWEAGLTLLIRGRYTTLQWPTCIELHDPPLISAVAAFSILWRTFWSVGSAFAIKQSTTAPF